MILRICFEFNFLLILFCCAVVDLAKTDKRISVKIHEGKEKNSYKIGTIMKKEVNKRLYWSKGDQRSRDGNSENHSYFDPVFSNHSEIKDYLQRERSFASRSRQELLQSSSNCFGECERSLCPWRMTWDDKSTRIPQFIRKAECQSRVCEFGFAGIDVAATILLHIHTECQTITTDIHVKDHGRNKVLRDWPIGCLCVKRRSGARYAKLQTAVSDNQDAISLNAGEASSTRVDFILPQQ